MRALKVPWGQLSAWCLAFTTVAGAANAFDKGKDASAVETSSFPRILICDELKKYY